MEKLDPQLARIVEEGASEEATAAPLVVLIQFSTAPDDRVLSKLKGMSVVVQSVAGDVVTARVPAQSLGQLSTFDEIVYVESSGRLFSE